MTFLADSPDAVFGAARAGGGVILLRPVSDSGLRDFPGVDWAGVEVEEAVREASAGAYVWVAQEDGGWTFAIPLIFHADAEPEIWLRTFRAGLRTGSRGVDDLNDASERWLTVLERSDWTALLAHPAAELRNWRCETSGGWFSRQGLRCKKRIKPPRAAVPSCHHIDNRANQLNPNHDAYLAVTRRGGEAG